jgi:hypothetical protein
VCACVCSEFCQETKQIRVQSKWDAEKSTRRTFDIGMHFDAVRSVQSASMQVIRYS